MRRLVVGGICVLGLAVPACGDEAADDGGTATSEEGSAATAPSDWCDELDRIREADEAPSEEAIDGAPEEVREPLRRLAGAEDTSPGPEAQAALMGDVATIEAWGHDHCSTQHPFCSLWLVVENEIATSAFVDAEDADAAVSDLLTLVRELDEVLRQHAPEEVEADLAFFLDSFPTSDANEREGEAVVDALDRWAYDEGCDGASPPEEDE